jgi:hypothetical protein
MADTVVYQVYRKEEMSPEEFADYWESVHVAVSGEDAPKFTRHFGVFTVDTYPIV